MIDARPLCLALLVPLLALGGCGGDGRESGDDTVTVDWDLSQSHGVEQVEFVRPELTANELAPVDSVRLELPAGKVFEPADGVVHDVSVAREGDQVTLVQVDSEPLENDAAHELALEWAGQFDLPLEPIEAWYDERGAPDADASTQTAGKPGSTIGDEGPAPSLQIRNSFEDERPAIVSMQFFWEPE